MKRMVAVAAVGVLILSIAGRVENKARPGAEPGCDVTLPNGVVPNLDASQIREVFGASPVPNHLRQFPSHGNQLLSVALFGLSQNGVTTGRPDPTIGVGWLQAKFGWMRAAKGPLKITGHRIDGDAAPLQSRIPDGYGDIGFQASGLIFSTPGCWQITAQIGDLADSKLTFIRKVVTAGSVISPSSNLPIFQF